MTWLDLAPFLLIVAGTIYFLGKLEEYLVKRSLEDERRRRRRGSR